MPVIADELFGSPRSEDEASSDIKNRRQRSIVTLSNEIRWRVSNLFRTYSYGGLSLHSKA